MMIGVRTVETCRACGSQTAPATVYCRTCRKEIQEQYGDENPTGSVSTPPKVAA